MADPFTTLVANLNTLGIFGFLLPFIFTFVVVYGLLLKAKFFEDQRIVGVLSIVVAFFTVGFGGPLLANFFVNLFGYAAIVIAGILVVVLFIAMSGGDVNKLFSNNKAVAIGVGAVGVIVFFIALGALGVGIGGEALSVVFIVILLVIAVMFVTQSN